MLFKYGFAAIFLLSTFSACETDKDADTIIDKSMKVHGADLLGHSNISFTFRGKQFRRYYHNGKFRYSRTFSDSAGHKIYQAINNDSTWQEVDSKHVVLPDSIRENIFESINSIVYFGFLPFKLNDEAVVKRYIGSSTINGDPYHEIEITFKKEGGGIDYQDRFVYWIHQNSYTIDYFGYRYEVDGGGERFREAYNIRNIKGIRIQDYKNYKVVADSLLPDRRIERFDQLYHDNKLELVSSVELEDVKIKLLN